MSDLLDMYTTQTHVLPELLRVCVSANGICQWHLRRDFLHRMPKNNIGNLERNVLTSPCCEFDVQQFADFRYSSGNGKQAELPLKASFWPQVWLPANGKPWKTPNVPSISAWE